MAKPILENRVSRRLRFRDLQLFSRSCNAEAWPRRPPNSALHSLRSRKRSPRWRTRSAFGYSIEAIGGSSSTIYGRALHKRGIAAFDELKLGIRDIEFLADPAKGEVRIACADSIAGAILAPMLQKFCRDYPGITLTIDPLRPTLEVPGLHARKLDVVLTRLSKPKDEDPFGDDLDVEILFDDEAVIAAGANSRWARRRKIAVADSLDATWVGTSQQALTTALMERAFRAANLAAENARDYSFDPVAGLPARGRRLSDHNAQVDARLNPECRGLKELPIRLPNSNFPVAIVTLKNRTLTAAVALFLDHLRSHVKSAVRLRN